MSFYGNISNAGKTQMSFDRVYPNRKIMEENASTDGVFVGRFVLIEYDKSFSNANFFISQSSLANAFTTRFPSIFSPTFVFKTAN